MLKKQVKQLFINTGQLGIMDKIVYALAILKYYRKNRLFRMQNPDFALPPDYFLYETYKLDYQAYKEDGEVSASEIYEWTSKYLADSELNILEWGCGVGRIIRHLPKFIGPKGRLIGCDIHPKMIEWNRKNLPAILFDTINYNPPTSYFSNQFDIIYGISVFTHIETERQAAWLHEIHRILQPGGIFLFTTHGRRYFNQLHQKNIESLLAEGAFTQTYKQKGHRMMTTYNDSNHFKALLQPQFEMLEFHDGLEEEDKVGGQDLWIVKKL